MQTYTGMRCAHVSHLHTCANQICVLGLDVTSTQVKYADVLTQTDSRVGGMYVRREYVRTQTDSRVRRSSMQTYVHRYAVCVCISFAHVRQSDLAPMDMDMQMCAHLQLCDCM